MHLQEFAIFNLPNLSFSLIFASGTFSIFYFFFHPPTWLLLVRNADAKSEPRAYICALEAGFFQVAKKCQVLCQTIGEVFFVVFAKTQRWQPDLANCWRCSTSSGSKFVAFYLHYLLHATPNNNFQI